MDENVSDEFTASTGESDVSDPVEENTPVDYEKNYKELESKFGSQGEELGLLRNQIKESESILSQYGGPKKAVEVLDYINSNDEFKEFVEMKKNQNILGTQGELEPDQLHAVETVKKLVQDGVSDYISSNVTPLIKQVQEKTINDNFLLMDSKHPGWRSFTPDMQKLSSMLPKEVLDNPSLDQIESLYYAAAGSAGKLMTKEQFQKEVESKINRSTNPQGSVGSVSAKRPKTIQEAFALAEMNK